MSFNFHKSLGIRLRLLIAYVLKFADGIHILNGEIQARTRSVPILLSISVEQKLIFFIANEGKGLNI